MNRTYPPPTRSGPPVKVALWGLCVIVVASLGYLIATLASSLAEPSNKFAQVLLVFGSLIAALVLIFICIAIGLPVVLMAVHYIRYREQQVKPKDLQESGVTLQDEDRVFLQLDMKTYQHFKAIEVPLERISNLGSQRRPIFLDFFHDSQVAVEVQPVFWQRVTKQLEVCNIELDDDGWYREKRLPRDDRVAEVIIVIFSILGEHTIAKQYRDQVHNRTRDQPTQPPIPIGVAI